MSKAAEPTGSLSVALGHAQRLLERDARLAAAQAAEILKVAPGHPHAQLILGAALRIAGQTQAALELLEPLAREQPRAAAVHLELGAALGEAGRGPEAITALRRAVALKPDLADGWRLLADQLDAAGDLAGADLTRARYIKAATHDPRLLEAAAALVANDLPVAQARLAAHLQRFPTDIAALRMQAEVAARLQHIVDALRLLERCLELAPGFDAARHNYASLLNRSGRAEAALKQIEQLLAKAPRDPGHRSLLAAILANLGSFDETVRVYEELLKEHPGQAKIWMSYGHALRTAGRQDDSVSAYRRAISMVPTLGEAYWSLANLKTFRFTDEEARAMRAALGRKDLADEDRVHFEFALGKTLEDAGSYEDSFAHYAAGNALRRRSHPYSADDNADLIRRLKELFTADFFAARAGWGCPTPDPIFIVGLPRAGSTLLEQILASHSLVEGTMELPDVPRIVHELNARAREAGPRFPELLAGLDRDALHALGAGYLESTRVQRKTGAPFFIDKNPNNWLYLGLIQLMLPNARIIDARRHPLACGFSCFKQHFARGQSFTYDLEDLGRYYRDYIELMAHFERTLPNRIHRVLYESMVADTESEVRRLLACCKLPFEAGCLRFYDNPRAVRTASSEQVRQPIFDEGLEHWRNYEPWLGPLKEALGPLLSEYPAAPATI
ncbi:MAG: tetratricopeptide repeat protein [Gammaproteobacteria bacterium]|nr:MAG: tetratricopeptide repeat protein [Gammaproteobacteria bacterium]